MASNLVVPSGIALSRRGNSATITCELCHQGVTVDAADDYVVDRMVDRFADHLCVGGQRA